MIIEGAIASRKTFGSIEFGTVFTFIDTPPGRLYMKCSYKGSDYTVGLHNGKIYKIINPDLSVYPVTAKVVVE